MADEVDEAIVEQAVNGSAEVIQEFTTERRAMWLGRLQACLNQLNEQYAYVEGKKGISTMNERKSVAEQLYKALQQDLLGVMKDEQHFQDNDVIIDPKRGVYISKNISKELQDIVHAQDIQNLKDARDQVYQIKQEADFTRATFNAMSVILELRSEIMQEQGMEEELGITYEFNGEIHLIRIPMQEFLHNEEIIQAMTVAQKAIAESRTGDPYQINFNSSVLDKIKTIWGTGTSIGKDSLEKYKTLTQQKIQKYRETPLYDVVAIGDQFTAQSGFVMEGLVEQYILGGDYQYAQDNIPWFGKADIYDKEKKVNISLKNMVSGSPTMVRLTSVHKVLQDLIRILSSSKTNEATKAALKSQIYAKVPKDTTKKIIYKAVEGTIAEGVV